MPNSDMISEIPEIELDEVDVLWVDKRDSIAREGLLKWAGKTFFFRSRIGEMKSPATYYLYELSEKEIKFETKLHEFYCQWVDENSEYVGNMRVLGGKTQPAEKVILYHQMIGNATRRGQRLYSRQVPKAFFVAEL